MCGCLSCVPHWGPGLQPGYVPWLGINRWPFASQAYAQSTELHQPGRNHDNLIYAYLDCAVLLCFASIPLFPFFFFFKILFIYFREGKGGRKRGRETSMCGCLLCAPYWGLGLQPRHVPQTGNWTGDPLVCRPALNPLSYTSQGSHCLCFKLSLLTKELKYEKFMKKAW